MQPYLQVRARRQRLPLRPGVLLQGRLRVHAAKDRRRGLALSAVFRGRPRPAPAWLDPPSIGEDMEYAIGAVLALVVGAFASPARK